MSSALMKEIIALTDKGINKGCGPFGALITHKGKIIAKANNTVTLDNDPTCHAEINAIRQAAKYLGTYDLTGCELYTTSEPCPMCFGAIYWANIEKIYYGTSKKDAAEAGFRDQFIHKEMDLQPGDRQKSFIQIFEKEAKKLFDKWNRLENKIAY
jgi:tRNA(Arg) A34 adenosine deaminase TadA